MAIEIEYECSNCGRYISWIYDEDEDGSRFDELSGCPGQECTNIHNITVQKIRDDED